jgi:hypothetical protein
MVASSRPSLRLSPGVFLVEGVTDFLREVEAGNIPLPSCPALVEDFYRCFVTWSRAGGDLFPIGLNKFVSSVRRSGNVRRVLVRVPNAKLEMKQRNVFLLGAPPKAHQASVEWARSGVARFSEAATAYCDEAAP